MLARRSVVDEQNFHHFLLLLIAVATVVCDQQKVAKHDSDLTKNTINDSLVGRTQRLKDMGEGEEIFHQMS